MNILKKKNDIKKKQESSLKEHSYKTSPVKVRKIKNTKRSNTSHLSLQETFEDADTKYFTKQEKLQIQEKELETGAHHTPLFEIKSGTYKSKKIHYATLKLGMQSVSDICEKAGFLLNAPQAQQVTDYLYLLQKWNQSMNLVGKNSWKDVLSELVIDSLYLAKFLEENPRVKQNNLPSFEHQASKKYIFNRQNFYTNSDINADFLLSNSAHSTEVSQKDNLRDSLCYNKYTTWDLGAGAGLPGIPLRMFWQLGHYYMIEVREKRSFFLNTALTTLGLQNTYVFRGKAEDFMTTKVKQNIYADLILSRAFMPFAKMLPFVAPYLRKEEQPHKTKSSIIFLSLEELDAKKYNSSHFSWETKTIYPYSVKNKQKFLCEVCFA